MKKWKILALLIFVFFFLGLVGCSNNNPNPIETISLEPPLYLMGGETKVDGFFEFWDEMQLIYGQMSMLGGEGFLEKIEEHFASLKKSNTILIIFPSKEGLQEYSGIAENYPCLCPLESSDLESKVNNYSTPLIYSCQDIQESVVRLVIVAKELYPPTAEAISGDIPLEVFLTCKDDQLLILE